MHLSSELPFKALGNKVTEGDLEPIKLNRKATITFESDEVTALCPVTGQPDWYKVVIWLSSDISIESKSLKLYLQKYRQVGIFAEHLAARIVDDVKSIVGSENWVTVTVTQKARGGITLTVTSDW